MHNNLGIEATVVIANYGMARKIVKFSKKHGMTGATVFYGKGTLKKSKLLELFDIVDIKKEIVFMLANKQTTQKVLPLLNEKFKFYKPNHGISFRMDVSKIIGSHILNDNNQIKEVKKHMYQAIITIVDKGLAEEVVIAARKAGSMGATIIEARGSGTHETSKLFNMDVEPEKEIILIISKADETNKITKAIKNDMHIDKEGKGIMFIQDINEVYGLDSHKKTTTYINESLT